jgi:Xaa-Pro dipeptidase
MGSEASKLVSSNELVYEWLSIKLPEEVEILKKAAQLAADFQV